MAFIFSRTGQMALSRKSCFCKTTDKRPPIALQPNGDYAPANNIALAYALHLAGNKPRARACAIALPD